MTLCWLTVHAPEGGWQGEVSSWTSLLVLGALSAEPESLGELAEAARRYWPEHLLFDLPRQTLEQETVSNGTWCVVDLVGRTVIAGEGFDLPDPHSAFKADADDHAEGFPIVWLDTPADWQFRHAGDDWRALVAERASARAAAKRVDARAVLFGLPLLEYLADGVLAAVADGPVDEQRDQELTRTLHARWLLTARADLGRKTPREVLLAQENRIAIDMQHRADQWSRQSCAAPPLPLGSTAYRLGGFGTTEVVLYFDLVRALLAQAWETTRQRTPLTQPRLVERLGRFRDRWLHEPHEDGGLLTPAELIESERRRMPVTSDGSHLDCDCPICQAEAEGEFGPAFLLFDGHHLELEDEFAFSMCATREDWDRQQDDYRKFSEEMDRKSREKAAAGEDTGDAPDGPVWQTSFVDWDAVVGSEGSPRQGLLALGFPLAELAAELKGRPDGADLMRSLNRAYGILGTSQDEVATRSAAQELCALLEVVSEKFIDLTPRCADLQSRLDEVLRLS